MIACGASSRERAGALSCVWCGGWRSGGRGEGNCFVLFFCLPFTSTRLDIILGVHFFCFRGPSGLTQAHLTTGYRIDWLEKWMRERSGERPSLFLYAVCLAKPATAPSYPHAPRTFTQPRTSSKMAAICSAVNCKFLVGAKVGARKAVRARASVAAPVQAKARDVFAPLRCEAVKKNDRCGGVW